MAKSNGHCGVGVAYNSRIGGDFYVDLDHQHTKYTSKFFSATTYSRICRFNEENKQSKQLLFSGLDTSR